MEWHQTQSQVKELSEEYVHNNKSVWIVLTVRIKVLGYSDGFGYNHSTTNSVLETNKDPERLTWTNPNKKFHNSQTDPWVSIHLMNKIFDPSTYFLCFLGTSLYNMNSGVSWLNTFFSINLLLIFERFLTSTFLIVVKTFFISFSHTCDGSLILWSLTKPWTYKFFVNWL